MKHLKPIHILAVLAVLAVAVIAAAACGDDDNEAGNGKTATPVPETLEIMEPFGRVALDRASAYFTVKNNGTTDDALVKVSTSVAGMAGLHETVTQGAETMMQPVDVIAVPAGGETQLKPGGYHVMLTDLKRELKVGDTYTLSLEFRSGARKDIEITVQSYTGDSMGGMGSATPTGEAMH